MRKATAIVNLFVQAEHVNSLSYNNKVIQGRHSHPDDGLIWVLVGFSVEDYLIRQIPGTDTFEIEPRV